MSLFTEKASAELFNAASAYFKSNDAKIRDFDNPFMLALEMQLKKQYDDADVFIHKDTGGCQQCDAEFFVAAVKSFGHIAVQAFQITPTEGNDLRITMHSRVKQEFSFNDDKSRQDFIIILIGRLNSKVATQVCKTQSKALPR